MSNESVTYGGSAHIAFKRACSSMFQGTKEAVTRLKGNKKHAAATSCGHECFRKDVSPSHMLVPVEQQVHLVNHDDRGGGATAPRAASAAAAKHLVQMLRRGSGAYAAARQCLRTDGVSPPPTQSRHSLR